MKLLIPLMIVLAVVSFPVAAAEADLGDKFDADFSINCGSGSVVNKAQQCANWAVDYGQERAYDIYCWLACP